MPQSLVIDANLLLLLIIGQIDEGQHLHKSNRLSAYDRKDLKKLRCVMAQFEKIIISPYLAAEVSNLIDLKDTLRQRAFQVARIFFSQFEQASVSVCQDAQHSAFIRYGITDASLAVLAKDYMIITNDNRLLPILFAVNSKNVLPFSTVREVVRL